MSNELSLFSGTPGSNLPDKPLIVKCNSNIRTQKLTSVNFRSARDCTYDNFQEKVLLSLNVSLILKQQYFSSESTSG